MDEYHLTCNNQLHGRGICRRSLLEVAIVTTCCHVFCLQCAKDTGLVGADAKNRRCPCCRSPLPNVGDAAETVLQPSEEYKSSVLSGFDPTTIMECASRALTWWNYQTLHEIGYQKHLLSALGNKYTHLSDAMNKLVDEANHEIESLHGTISKLSETNDVLQQKNVGLANDCQKGDKRYTQLRKMYDTLKKRSLLGQEQSMSVENTEHALRNLTTNHVQPGAYDENNGGVVNTAGNTPHIANNPSGADQLYARQFQNANSNTHFSSNVMSTLPPKRSTNRPGVAPFEMLAQHRTPLPGALRVPGTNHHHAQLSTAMHQTANHQVDHATGHAGLPLSMPGSRHRARTRNNRTSISSGGYGGIIGGMKVGSATANIGNSPQQQHGQNTYIPTHGFHGRNHRHNISAPTAGPGY